MRTYLVTLGMVMSLQVVSMAKWRTQNNPDNPWGNNVMWVDIDEAYNIGKRTDVPIMLIIWRKGCPACEVLQKQLKNDRQFMIVSRYFSMVEAEVPLHPFTKHDKFNIDGQYIPRIFFLDGDGNILKEYDNGSKTKNYRYYYENASRITPIMKQVKADYAYGVHREL